LKVGQVARRLAERIVSHPPTGAAGELAGFLNVDAAEAAGLAHDLGHPPFGHLAEVELNDRAGGFGGFEGNAQTFRIVTRLALRDSTQAGLNLTRRTLNGILKYPCIWDPNDEQKSKKWGAYPEDGKAFAWARDGYGAEQRTLEAQLMDWSDDVTYAVHDTDDFFRAGLVPLDRLCTNPRELDAFCEFVSKRHSKEKDRPAAAAHRLFDNGIFRIQDRYQGTTEDRVLLRIQGSELITRYVNDVSLTNGKGAAFFEVDDELADEVMVLKDLTWYYVIENPALAILQRGQRRIIQELFDGYWEAIENNELRLFPAAYRERLERQAKTKAAKLRAIVDLIAGLSEPAAEEIFRRMGGMVSGSVLHPAGRLS